MQKQRGARLPDAGPARAADVASQTTRAFIGVRELVLRGHFTRGERISELRLVAQLGMSRTPIRLALERLANIGLLDVGPSGGFTMREFTLAEVYDAIDLRGVLEGTAARLAAERLTGDGELAGLRQRCRQMEALERLTIDSFAQYMDMNEAFHAEIVDLAKNATLRRTLGQVNSLPFALPSAMVFPTSILPRSDETLAIAHEHHRAIVDAISRRQGTRAEGVAREHAGVARGVLELALSNADALSQVPGGSLINTSRR